jgi:hypothetical protein
MLKPNIFISYKRDDQPTIDAMARVETALAREGLGVWRDVNIEPGANWSNEVYTWLMECSGAVVLLGKEAARSEWCRREWWFLRERKHTTGLPIIPISVDGSYESAGIFDDIQAFALKDAAVDEVLAKLRGLQTAAPSAKNYLAAHHAWLRYQFNEAPLLGREPFSLHDVYVETDCGELTWGDMSTKPCDPFKEKHGGRYNLVQAVMDRLSDPEFRDLIVVQGPPGCGKSAFTLKLADELLRCGLHPVLARFRDFRLQTFDRADELIEDALRIGPIEEQPPRPKQPLFEADRLNQTMLLRKAQISELVFILDGWDEVSLTGSISYQNQLQTWLPKIREFFVDRPGQPIRLILTGRPSAEVRASGILKANTPVLTVRHMVPTALEGFARAIDAQLSSPPMPDSGHWRVHLGRLEPIFARYDQWFRSVDAKTGHSHNMEVLGSPLLAFLTFRTLADWTGDARELTDNPAALYKVLIDTTVEHAGKGRDEDVRSGVHRGGEKLRRLLHKVASVISVLGSEAASFTELDARLRDDPAFQDWSSRDGLLHVVDEATRRSVLHELVVNFYFKGGNTGIGCEFLHKSFREYLFAEAIVAALKDLSEGRNGPLAHARVAFWQDFPEGTCQHKASRTLSRLLASQWLRNEVRGHLHWLLSYEIKREPERWVWLRDLILDVYIWWAEGVHLRPQPHTERGVRLWNPAFINDLLKDALPFDQQAEAYPTRSTLLDAHLGAALMQITAKIYNELIGMPREPDPQDSLRRNYRTTDEKVHFIPGGEGYFDELCARINAAGGWFRIAGGAQFPSAALLPRMSLDSGTSAANFSYTDLTMAHLQDAGLAGDEMAGANLTGANLNVANLTGANLTSARLTSANLTDANLNRANLAFADLTGADLPDADLTGANLNVANLTGANLTDASLIGADLTRADLTNASLTGADLTNAILKDTILPKAFVKLLPKDNKRPNNKKPRQRPSATPPHKRRVPT